MAIKAWILYLIKLRFIVWLYASYGWKCFVLIYLYFSLALVCPQCPHIHTYFGLIHVHVFFLEILGFILSTSCLQALYQLSHASRHFFFFFHIHAHIFCLGLTLDHDSFNSTSCYSSWNYRHVLAHLAYLWTWVITDFLCGQASNWDLPKFYLPSSWDYSMRPCTWLMHHQFNMHVCICTSSIMRICRYSVLFYENILVSWNCFNKSQKQ
jgi:hypothetical protein